AQLARNTLDLLARTGRARDDGTATDLAEQLDRVVAQVERRAAARREGRLGQTDRETSLRRVVDERGRWCNLPQEGDEPRFRIEVERRRDAAGLSVAGLELRACERHGGREGGKKNVTVAPAPRNPTHVLHEPDGAHDRRRVDRPAVRLVVERHVSGDDG